MRRPHALPVLISLLWFTIAASAFAQQTRNVTLLGHLDVRADYTNCWAYVHPDGREYALVGTRLGTSIVRLTDPTNPVEVAFIPGESCTTRDADQYGTYVYSIGGLCAAGAEPGLQIISMADPDHPVLVKTVHGVVENAENVTIDPARGLLFASDFNQTSPGSTRGLAIISLADPLNPVELFFTSYPVHDFTAAGTIGYAQDVIDWVLHVLDTTNPAAPQELAAVTGLVAVHSSWPTVDNQTLYATQEDLQGGRVSILNIANPAQISVLKALDLYPLSTAHYVRILGNRAYFSYYSAGARVWDVSNTTWPAEIGVLDTWSGEDLLIAGAYDTCPFFPSGIAIATDMQSGLYVYRVGLNYGLVRGALTEGRYPLAGATVRALPDGPSTATAADGLFALAPAVGTGVTIEASKFGYGAQTATVDIAQGSDQTVNFSMSQLATGAIKGTVVSAVDQSGLAEAEVAGVGAPISTLTGSHGTYSLTKVPAVTLTLRSEGVGFVPATATVPVVAKKTATANFALQPALFYDDAETDRGWTLGAPDDNATTGQWIRAVPVGTFDQAAGVQVQPDADHTPGTGTMCFVTGNGAPHGAPSDADVDGGKTTLISPALPLSGVSDPRIVYWRWFYTNNGRYGPDKPAFITDISNDDGASWTRVDSVQARNHGLWERHEIRVLDYFGSPMNVRVRFVARDNSLSASVLTEGAVDDFEYYSGASLGSGTVLAAQGPAERDAALQLTRIPGAAGAASFELRSNRAVLGAVRVFDVNGRLVRTIFKGRLSEGSNRLAWDGRTERGVKAAGGVYVLQASAGVSRASAKLVLLR